MTMPIDLVLVRHGESEQNLALRAAKQGDVSMIHDAYRATVASQFRLSKTGQHQARVTGEWLRNNDFGFFDRRYVSDYMRAKETAALLDITGPHWFVETALREREWGDLDGLSWEEREQLMQSQVRQRTGDSFYWVPPNGESIAQLTVRLRSLFDSLHRECFDKRVVVVCHGEVMWGLRFMLERMSTNQWMKLESSQAPGIKIYNCQILHYTRRNPETGELSSHLDWMRSECPQNPKNSGPGWQRIVRQRFTDAELLAAVEVSPHLFQ